MFQDNKMLGKESLKFAKSFHVTVAHEDVTEVGRVQDYWPAGKILAEFGMTVADFDTNEELLKAVQHLCKSNAEEHGYELKEAKIDEVFPQFSKFWYVFNLGKKQTHVGTVAKKLEQESELKDLKQLETAKMFMEGIGFRPDDGPSSSSVLIENVKYNALITQVDILK